MLDAKIKTLDNAFVEIAQAALGEKASITFTWILMAFTSIVTLIVSFSLNFFLNYDNSERMLSMLQNRDKLQKRSESVVTSPLLSTTQIRLYKYIDNLNKTRNDAFN